MSGVVQPMVNGIFDAETFSELFMIHPLAVLVRWVDHEDTEYPLVEGLAYAGVRSRRGSLRGHAGGSIRGLSGI